MGTEKIFEVKEEVNGNSKGLYRKAKRIISLTTVEPIIVCYIIPQVLLSIATQNLYLEKACRVNLGLEQHICDALSRRDTANYTLQEEEVQKAVAVVTGWKSILQSLLPCALLLFFGAYSDRVRQRKFCIILPVVGEIIANIGLIINTYFFYELPMEVAAVTETIFPALGGGGPTFAMGVYSYITDVTTEEERTFRIGIVTICFSIGLCIGASISGITMQKIGFYGVFFVCTSSFTVGFIYAFFRIKEVKKIDPTVNPVRSNCQRIMNFFDIKHVKETLTVVFKNGPNKRRLRIILLLICMCVIIGPVHGEMALIYLFTRYRFNWNEVDFSIFLTYSLATSILGTLCCVAIFNRLLKFDDAIIGVITCTSKILSTFMYAFATKTWHIYTAPLIDIFSKASTTATRAIVSKIIPSDDLGKVNSCFGLAEAMMPLVYTPMYTAIYTATLNTLPGAFFLVGGALLLPAVLIFLWMYFYNKKLQRSTTADAESTKL